jgi:hypothetical protein
MQVPSPTHRGPQKTASPNSMPHQEIVFRGMVYSGLEAMPYEERQAYAELLEALGATISTGVQDAWEEQAPSRSRPHGENES